MPGTRQGIDPACTVLISSVNFRQECRKRECIAAPRSLKARMHSVVTYGNDVRVYLHIERGGEILTQAATGEPCGGRHIQTAGVS